MNNRNMVIFVAASILMLLGYNFAMNKMYPHKPAPAQVQVVQGAAQAPAAAAVQAPAASSPAATPAAAGALDTMARFTLENPSLKLTWRKQDGALVQAQWKDGTKFFPEAMQTRGKEVYRLSPVEVARALEQDKLELSQGREVQRLEEVSRNFDGLGAAIGTRFDGDPTVTPVAGGTEVAFTSAQGDRLVYRVPADGHILTMHWTSKRGAGLNLMPMPDKPLPIHGLGRVFTLDNKNINAVSWMDMLKDPFFSFVGAKRKVLPPASNKVGMDAGVDAGAAQRAWYFAAIWDASSVAQRDTEQTPGYNLFPDASGTASARLYLGPKQAEELGAFHAPGQPSEGKIFFKVMDFGFFGLVAQFLFLILRGIHKVVPNWGYAIVLLTVVIRGTLWPLNTKTTVQMLRMKELEPHQKALQAKYEKFGNDMAKKAEMQKELMAFYKKNGHNPMGGCLPMILQMPVFFALWSMLNAVFELRHAPFVFWLKDLSAADPFFVLPILMGVSMIIQQAMTPSVGDPTQRKMMMVMMPVMFTFFFARTPSGLCLYYLFFNVIGILQTWIVMRSYKPQPVVV